MEITLWFLTLLQGLAFLVEFRKPMLKINLILIFSIKIEIEIEIEMHEKTFIIGGIFEEASFVVLEIYN